MGSHLRVMKQRLPKNHLPATLKKRKLKKSSKSVAIGEIPTAKELAPSIARGSSHKRQHVITFPVCKHGLNFTISDQVRISPLLILFKIIPWIFTAFVAFFGIVNFSEIQTFFSTRTVSALSLTDERDWLKILPVGSLLSFFRGNPNLIKAIFVILLFSPLIAWWYWAQYYKTYKLKVVGFRLVNESGVFMRRIDTRIIFPVCVFSVRRSLLEFLFGLYTVRMYMASGSRPDGPKRFQHLDFPALSYQESRVIEQYFIDNVSCMIAPSKAALDASVSQNNYSLHLSNDSPDGSGSGDSSGGGDGASGD